MINRGHDQRGLPHRGSALQHAGHCSTQHDDQPNGTEAGWLLGSPYCHDVNNTRSLAGFDITKITC
jgi:hypothetical protein